MDRTRTFVESRQRSFVGKLFKWAFIGFNFLMLWWMGDYLVHISNVYSTAGSDAGRAGASIGAFMGLSAIIMLWMLGDIILGLMVLFTRGKKIITERLA
jgi:hypothetical protein